jgi:hypothetical protein
MFEKSCQCQVHRTWYRLHASSPEAEVSTYSTEFDGSQDFSNTLLEANGKLVRISATLTSEDTYLKASAAKKKEKETSVSVAILEFVRKVGDAGANITEIRAAMKEICIGSGTVNRHLGELVKANLIFAEERGKEKRYFAVGAA